MNFKSGIFLILFAIININFAGAAEYSDGALRLVLHENTGRFSLYYTGDANQGKGQALFSDDDPRTSFLSVIVNDRSYKMGNSASFRIRADENDSAFTFESPFMIVREKFSFVKTPNSTITNAVKIQITVENRSDRQVSAGARFLLDTKLGEGASGFPFSTNRRTINSETLLIRSDEDQFWTDKNDKLSLTGSFITGAREDPDSIHFANWKKLSDVGWKAPYQAGRNFNYPPYSIGDTAVCYYFDIRPLDREEKMDFAFILAANYEGRFTVSPALSSPVTVSSTPSGSSAAAQSQEPIVNLAGRQDADSRARDLAELRELIATMEARIASGKATEKEIIEMEFALNKIRAKYSPDNSLRQRP